MMKRIKNREGFTLLEVLISLAVLAIGMLGIAGMMLMSIRGNTSASRISEATNLAQDKIEEIRAADYTNLYGSCNSPALWNGGDPLKCTEAPTNMAEADGTLFGASDNGTNGDEVANDGKWTYQFASPPATEPLDNNFELIWGVQRNFPGIGLIWGFAEASWTDSTGNPHTIRLETVKDSIF